MSAEETTPPNQAKPPPYNRDAIIASLTRYYTLLSKTVSIKPKDIAYPPEGGWGDDVLPLAKLQRLGFNDRAVDLVRHLPYVFGNRPVFPGTECIIYLKNVMEGSDEDYELEDPHMVGMWPLPEQRIPEGVVPLARMGGGDPGYTWWILETGTGELTAHTATLQRPSDEVPEDAEWRSARPVPATTYFDGLCEDLRSLRLIPLPGHPEATLDLYEIWPDGQNMHASERKWVDKAKEIYRWCGWPDVEKFKRQKCLKVLLELQDRRWKEQVEERDRKREQEAPPPAYTDVHGNPVPAPANAESED